MSGMAKLVIAMWAGRQGVGQGMEQGNPALTLCRKAGAGADVQKAMCVLARAELAGAGHLHLR